MADTSSVYINADEFYNYINFYRREFQYTTPMTIEDFLECINLYKRKHGVGLKELKKDCISRAELIEAIKRTDWEAGVDESLAHDIATHIDPADAQETKWVSIKERLPEDKNENYWICTDTGYQCECRWTNVNPFWTHLETDWHWNIMDIPQYSKVAAWMPLPKPYVEAE